MGYEDLQLIPFDPLLMMQETLQWNAVATPNELTTGLAVLLVGLLALFLYAGVKLRSVVTLGTWMFAVVALMFAVLVNVPLRFFFIIISINAVMVLFSTAVAIVYGDQI